MTVSIVKADLDDGAHAAAFLSVLGAYALHPYGGGAPLRDDVRERLVPAMKALPNTLVLLAFDGDEAVGLANCLFGFSSFAARPTLNVHDLAVVEERRGQGIGRALLTEARNRARARDCVKMTLEVREPNTNARGLYASFGFDDSDERRTFFLENYLDR